MSTLLFIVVIMWGIGLIVLGIKTIYYLVLLVNAVREARQEKRELQQALMEYSILQKKIANQERGA